MKELKKIFTEMLNNIDCDFSEEKLTAQFPIKGHKYNHELMVVGRATNGWGSEEDNMRWNPHKIKPSGRIIDNIIKYSTPEKNGDCPMKWITDHWGLDTKQNKKEKVPYNMKKSAFWRVIKEILIKLEITSSDEQYWSSYLVWSNLYKIASPEGGNPSSKLCGAQFDNCKTILKEEIKYYKPKRILFLTGVNWFTDFEDSIDFKKDSFPAALVEQVGSIGKIKIIVAKHPQGKKESKYVEEVKNHFSKRGR